MRIKPIQFVILWTCSGKKPLWRFVKLLHVTTVKTVYGNNDCSICITCGDIFFSHSFIGTYVDYNLAFVNKFDCIGLVETLLHPTLSLTTRFFYKSVLNLTIYNHIWQTFGNIISIISNCLYLPTL